MNHEKLEQLYEKLNREAEDAKQQMIRDIGAVDFHFQVPNFDNPLQMIPSLLNEITQYANTMHDFHAKRSEERDHPLEALLEVSKAEMWTIWNQWNAVIGMVLCSRDTQLMDAFNQMIRTFAEGEILNSNDEEGN